MLKKFVALTVICTTLLLVTGPAMAMLKVLDPEISDELTEIARKYLVETFKVKPEAITIEDGWVREFWNEKVDVYMVEVTLDKGLATEKKLQVPVRVDQKVVLTEAELTALQEKEAASGQSNPEVRIMTATENDPTSADKTTSNTLYYVLGIALAVFLSVAAFKILRKEKVR